MWQKKHIPLLRDLIPVCNIVWLDLQHSLSLVLACSLPCSKQPPPLASSQSPADGWRACVRRMVIFRQSRLPSIWPFYVVFTHNLREGEKWGIRKGFLLGKYDREWIHIVIWGWNGQSCQSHWANVQCLELHLCHLCSCKWHFLRWSVSKWWGYA